MTWDSALFLERNDFITSFYFTPAHRQRASDRTRFVEQTWRSMISLKTTRTSSAWQGFRDKRRKKQRWKNRKILIPCCLPASIKDTVDVPIIHYWTLTGTFFFLLWVLVRNYSAKHLFAVVRCARVEHVPLTLFLLPLASSLLFVLPYTVDIPWGYFIHYTLSLLRASLTGSFSLFLVFFRFFFRWILSL